MDDLLDVKSLSIKEKEAALVALLQEERKRLGASPLQNIREHPKQLELTCSKAPTRAFFGGNRTGKTEWGAHEVARFLHKRHPVKEIQAQLDAQKSVEIWACCPSFDVQEDTTQRKLLALLDKSRIQSTTKIRGDIISTLKYIADDGSITKISFKSYDQGREKFQGAGKSLIWFDEEPPKNIYDEATVRYEAGQRLFVILTMTPVNGLTWVYDDIYLKTNDPNIHVVVASWNDNIFLNEDQKREMRARFTDSALQVREKGMFLARTGLVCDWWSRDTHLVENIQSLIPPGSDIYKAIDFGFAVPTCVIYAAVDSNSTIYIFDGIYKRGLTTPDLARAMIRKDLNLKIKETIADSSQAADIKQLNEMTELDGNRVAFSITPVSKTSGSSKENWDEYRAKIMNDYGRFNPRTHRPRILISSDLIHWDAKKDKEVNWAVAEIESVRWDEVRRDGDKTPRSRWDTRTDQHFLDALSYLLSYITMPTDYSKEYEEKGPIFEDSWVA